MQPGQLADFFRLAGPLQNQFYWRIHPVAALIAEQVNLGHILAHKSP